MLKFIRHHLDTINGVGLYPTLSFIIFFGFFLLVLLWVRKTGRTHIDHMSSLPLADEPHTSGTDHHAH